MKDLIKTLGLTPEIEAISIHILDGGRLTREQGVALFEHAPLALLGTLATFRKELKSGRKVYYNKNIHIEPTNICVFRCKFCSYRRPAGDPLSWYYSLGDIENIVRDHAGKGITEVHIVGGVHPNHTLEDYIAMVSAVKHAMPEVVVKAYSAVELHYIIHKAGLSLGDGLQKLKDAGMLAMPGGGAEIFAPEIRSQICPEKCSSEEWLETHRVAHSLGIATNATILYGHIENYAHRIDHMDRLRTLQDETQGFDAFIPLQFRAANNPMSSSGEVPLTETMRMMAMARLYLDNFPHLKAYWAMMGRQAAQLALNFGADDLDGTIDDTTKIYSMAGAEEAKPAMSSQEIENLILQTGFEPFERDTFYNRVVIK